MFVNHKVTSRLLLLLPALLLACKKDPAEPAAPEIRLFTNKLEITDAAVKAKFLARPRAAAAFQVLPTTGTSKITFVAPDTATFGTSSIRFSVVKKDEQYLFYSPPLVQLSEKDLLIYDMLKYTASKIPVPCGNGSLSGCYVTKEVRVGYGDAKQLQLSYLQYYWARPYGWSSGLLFNELNEGVVTRVSSLDTLAVRVGRVSFTGQ